MEMMGIITALDSCFISQELRPCVPVDKLLDVGQIHQCPGLNSSMSIQALLPLALLSCFKAIHILFQGQTMHFPNACVFRNVYIFVCCIKIYHVLLNICRRLKNILKIFLKIYIEKSCNTLIFFTLDRSLFISTQKSVSQFS